MKKNRFLPVSLALVMALAMTLSAVSVIAVAATPEQTASAPDLTDPKYEVMPDTWVFTDSLGRTSLTNAEVGDLRADKTLAMFYWSWHTDEIGADEQEPFNVNDFMLEHPEIKNDYESDLWPTSNTAYFWNEPIWGYYHGTDEWVVRKQAEMLANAGVDVIFTDNTNGTHVWKESYDVIYDVWSDAMDDGVNTPKVSFMLPFIGNNATNKQLKMLYEDIYKKGDHQELWFYWDEKPMLMAWNDNINIDDPVMKELSTFFTFRNNQPSYRDPYANQTTGRWGWLSVYPQDYYYGDRGEMVQGIVEQVTVGVAVNYNYVKNQGTAMNGENVVGRSYTSAVGKGEIPYPTDPDSKLYGYHFAEQFDYALELDPKVVFVTGWNEWTAGRHADWGNTINAFPDEYNDEYSRDIEPSRGDLGDTYYYQLVNYSRKFQGARPIPTPSVATTIDIKGGVEQWNTVAPFYAAYYGNTDDRDADGYGSMHYTDFSGRNDIIGSQVARDDEMVYFLVECADVITPYTDPLWMTLYIDCNQANQGWETFDYVINKTSPSATHAALERFVDGYESELVGTVEYTVDGRYMQVAVPKSMLGLEGNDFTINFSWTDNVHDWEDQGVTDPTDGSVIYSEFNGDILDFYTSGDVAPGMRFKYSYVSTDENTNPGSETESATETVEETTDIPAVETEKVTTAVQETTEAITEEITTAPVAGVGCKSSFVGLLPTAAVLGLSGACLMKRKKKD